MLDHVRSPYGPREVDVTGDPRHWPCGTGLEASAPVAYESAATAAARLRTHESRLRAAARSRGLLAGAQRGRPVAGGGGGAVLAAEVWTGVHAALVAAAKRPGPRSRAA